MTAIEWTATGLGIRTVGSGLYRVYGANGSEVPMSLLPAPNRFRRLLPVKPNDYNIEWAFCANEEQQESVIDAQRSEFPMQLGSAEGICLCPATWRAVLVWRDR